MATKKMQKNSFSLSLPEDNKLLTIKNWIADNKGCFQFAIKETICRKWDKWHQFKATPYPCVCTQRDKYCIELELYYELQRVVEICEQGTYFEQAIEKFNSINKHDKNAVCSWVKKYKMVGRKLFFSSTITILCNAEENNKLIIQLNPDEFDAVIRFHEIFNTVYYSEEFQTNFNQ
ncbi:hypothetical protein [Flavobacterium sp. NRK1]|uniref:hypothetical protein n=1 Tax=Flavobacterium sp. NRK1 TaxID=2954929 RepID=UPI002092BAEE|nr:hypothetical protein [Flavobacterium sp. NRK1]MCO6147392.1 hypothetical protein [Flavobacterium sp. NRK1]